MAHAPSPEESYPSHENECLKSPKNYPDDGQFGSKALIGEGSYGRVYYANLENGKAVAVKKLDVSSEPESNVEFLTQHENLVELLGYCVEGNLRVLAYEFATMGSLD
ncbi:hypothetical protein KPL70_017226 [Citrus sinensis]|nr:hypothetical protein KPL70_017226 [Citrus sinensis]